MATLKVNDYAFLTDVVRALLDENVSVQIETVNARQIGFNTYSIMDKPQILTKQGRIIYGGDNANSRYANSVKIGKNISIERVMLPPTLVESKSGKVYEVDNGFYYRVKTPKGIVGFRNTNDFMPVWWGALMRTENRSVQDVRKMFNYNETNETLRAVLDEKSGSKTKKDKYEQALAQLKSMGIQPGRLAQYIADKQKKSQE